MTRRFGKVVALALVALALVAAVSGGTADARKKKKRIPAIRDIVVVCQGEDTCTETESPDGRTSTITITDPVDGPGNGTGTGTGTGTGGGNGFPAGIEVASLDARIEGTETHTVNVGPWTFEIQAATDDCQDWTLEHATAAFQGISDDGGAFEEDTPGTAENIGGADAYNGFAATTVNGEDSVSGVAQCVSEDDFDGDVDDDFATPQGHVIYTPA